ncbi:hypothetical protein PoB_000261800 [Plakobranchus ocellatus]|uniref:Uncharacterized protein n=1 Tax=Plakobranchus ocellatus TaxID=259542 RepID=A0AAV3Y0D7_9GAST|nr:hypothetical protein PoB_000261800 [Plakobranchus ocellatus]
MVKQIVEKCDISRHFCYCQPSQEREQLQGSDSLSQSKTLIRGAGGGGNDWRHSPSRSQSASGMPLWCKDFAEHGNANSRLTKSARFGEPTLYPAFTLSDYRICDSRHPLSVLRSLISAVLGISTVNQVIRSR